ncbi:LacI family DNA-binding transcriptional regulator [Kiloniella sp. b19]|uniref:LacI family DNA-binding transcriptional regulator n=1 Tax=Kiloniella sp. GXU_MW_B19 TaxID=3141326 RepID=UPI0031D1D479
MNRKPTLKDVALLAEVSEMTASRVLRGVGDVSPKTRERVRHAVQELGYVPNRIAGGLASRSVNLVAVIVPSIRNYVFPDVLTGISDALSGSLLQPVFGISNYDPDQEERVIADMLSWQPRGLIIAGLHHTEIATKMLAAADIPIVEIMDCDGTPVDACVGISHRQAGQDMARLILERGYSRIGFAGTQMPLDFRAGKRLKGFEDTLGEAGLQLHDQIYYDEHSSTAKGREMTAALLERSPDLDCIYYSSDLLAAGGIMHCMSNGLTIPDDIALAGFNGLEMLDGFPIELATSHVPRYDIGFRAAQHVLDASRNRDSQASRPDLIDQLELKTSAGETL